MEKNCCHSPLTDESAKALLTESGLNRTKVKIKLLLELSKSHKPLSAADLHHKMKESCDLSTIFRTLTQFKEKSLIQEVNLDEGFLRYEMNDNTGDHKGHHHHHHHVRCRVCGDIKNLEECDLSPFEKAIAKLGFKQMEHRLEFTGICSKCS